MDGQLGTIVDLNIHDAMGWIELDGGGRVRFGGTSLAGFATNPGPGTRVLVQGTTSGYQDVIKAVRVVPAEPPAAAAMVAATAIASSEVAWPDFVRAHPRWCDAVEASLPFPQDIAPLALTAHPLWSPWIDELARSPVCVGLRIPDYQHRDPIEPTPADSFAHGRVAFLDEPTWPCCRRCAAPLELCIQLGPPLLAAWGLGERGIVALVCFECVYAHGTDQRIGHVAFTTGRVRVEHPVPADPGASMVQSQRVTAAPPARLPAFSSWLRYRATVRPDTAAARLLGAQAVTIRGPFPPDLDPDDLDGLDGDMVDEMFDEWIGGCLPRGTWGGGRMGGVPSWDQRDRTPHCTTDPQHGEARQLFEYDGGQFLDGALHVFMCREPGCEQLAFVAEL